MKKTIIIIQLCVLISNILIAQKRSKLTQFGGKLGLTHSYMNFNKGYPPSATPISGSWGTGVVFGGFLQVSLSKNIFLQPEYLFQTTSSKRDDPATTFHLTYLSFPIILKYSPTKRLNILLGPQFDLLLHAKQKKDATTNITHDTEERNIGVSGGAEFFLLKNFSVGARYTSGLNDIGTGQRSSVLEYKSQQVILTASFYLE